MAFDEKLKAKVLKRVVKKPRTGNEVGEPLGYSGRGIGRVLAELCKDKKVFKINSRPPTYTTDKATAVKANKPAPKGKKR